MFARCRAHSDRCQPRRAACPSPPPEPLPAGLAAVAPAWDRVVTARHTGGGIPAFRLRHGRFRAIVL
ncbi:hypothetical protein Y5A_007565 [Burkholderia glumae AU6208]|nr:hypothetical protein Y5A_007565 [Burkholderia glumae AU6208]